MKKVMPSYKQPQGSVLCGPVCLQMLYDYYHLKKSLKQILREVKMHKKGTHIAELGYSFLKNNFDVTIWSMDVRQFPPECQKDPGTAGQ